MPQVQEKPRDLWTDEEFIEAHRRAAKALRRPFYLGKLKRPGWSGRIKTYLVWCEPCDRYRPEGGYTVAHEAGHGKRLECGYCRTRYDRLLPSRRIKDALLNPHRHPWLIAALILAAFLMAIASR